MSTLKAGSHTIKVTLGSDAVSGNYKIASGNQKTINIGKKAVVLDENKLEWQYKHDGNSALLAGATLTYDGKEFTFELKTLPTGVGSAVCQDKLINAGTHEITITLTPSSDYAFYDEKGNELTSKPVKKSVEIGKASVDLSKVVWQTTSMEYNGNEQKIEVSGLPSFIAATDLVYSGNKGTNVGEYTAKLTGINTASNENYNIPSTSELEAANIHTTWHITKAKIKVEWKSDEVTKDGKTITFQVLNVDSKIKLVYTYYAADNSTVIGEGDAGRDKIFAAFSTTDEQTYWVHVKLAEGTEGYTGNNCVLVENNVEKQEVTKSFTTGGNKKKAVVTMSTDVSKGLTFNGEVQKLNISVEGQNLTAADWTVTYKNKAGAVVDPKEVNEYTATVTLNADGYELVGQSTFEFEIVPLKIAKPTFDGEYIFNTTGYDFLETSGLPEGWDKYLDITITKGGTDIAPVDGNWTLKDAGDYYINIFFKEGINTYPIYNVIWTDASGADDTDDIENLKFTIAKKVFEVTGWTETTGIKKPTPITTDDPVELMTYFDIVVKDGSGNVVSGKLEYSTTYNIYLQAKTEYSDNVAVKYDGVEGAYTKPYSFTTGESSGGDTGETDKKVLVSLLTDVSKPFVYNGTAFELLFDAMDIGGFTKADLVITYFCGDTPVDKAINAGKYTAKVTTSKEGFVLEGVTEVAFEISPLRITMPTADLRNTFRDEGYTLADILPDLPTDWQKYLIVTAVTASRESVIVDENWKATNAMQYNLQFEFKQGVNIASGGSVDNVVWTKDGVDNTDKLQVQFYVDPLVIVVSDWQKATSNNAPTVTAEDADLLNKYLQYVVTDSSGNAVSGTLQFDTSYSIALKVKDDYAGNVLVKQGDKTAAETTAAYTFKTWKDPFTDPDNPGGGDGDGDGTGGDGTGGDGTGGNGSGSGNNNGNNNNGGGNSDVKYVGGVPYYVWILVAAVFLLIIMMFIMIMRRDKTPPPAPQQPIIYYPPTPSLTPEQMAQYGANNTPQLGGGAPLQLPNNGNNMQNMSGENIWNGRYGGMNNGWNGGFGGAANNIIPVNPNSMTPDDWTFMISEKDVLNPDVLAQSNGNFVLYAVNKDDAQTFQTLQDGERVLNNKVAEDMRTAFNNQIHGGAPEVKAEKVDDDARGRK